MWWLLAFTTGLSLALGPPMRLLGVRLGLRARALIPTTGGLALIAAWWVAVLIGNAGALHRFLPGLGAATLVVVIVGLIDTKRSLGPLVQGFAHAGAAGLAVGSGIMATVVTHPFGGLFRLDTWVLAGVPIVSLLVTAVWIIALMNAINFLDGVDGIAATVSGIGFGAIGVVSLLPHVNEPGVALPAFLAAAALAGFLFWNFPPAALYLGTPGAWFLGFLLAVLSVLGSSKIATLAVVGAIPLLDAATVILSRVRRGVSPFRGDRTHLHHRLLARGWSSRHLVALYGAASAGLGIAAVLLPTPTKVLLVVCGIAVLLARSRGVENAR